tara:strand:- start:12 stop:266 length:255 start_codon:yes stop_codon:yes gene_type:complete
MLTWAGLTARPSNEGKKMKYLVLKSCFAAGARRTVGDVVEIDASEANQLVSMARISAAPAPKPEVETVDRSAVPASTRKAKAKK